MADFQSGVNEVPLQRATVAPNPVDTGAANAISTAGNFLGAVGGTVAQAYGQGQQLQVAKQNAGFIQGYADDLLRVADLEQQGVLKPDQALRQYRLRTSRMLANHPLQQEEIFKTYGNIIDKAGLGQNVVKDYQQGQDNANTLKMASLQRAQAAGWGSPNDTPEVQQNLAEKHQQFLFAQSQMEAANALLEHKVKENQLVSSGLSIQNERAQLANQSITMQRNRIGLAQDQAKQQFLQGAQTLSDAYFGKWQQDTARIAAQVGQQVPDGKGGTTTYTGEMASRDIDSQLAAIHQQTGALAAGYDSTGSLEALTKPLDMLAQATKDQVTGKTKSEVTANTISNIIGTKNMQLLTSDPKFLTLTATSKMIPAGAGALQQSLGNAAIDLLKRNKVIPGDESAVPTKPGDITHNDDPDHNKGVDQYFKIVKTSLSNMNAGIKDPDLKTEIDGNISNILKGVGLYGPTAASPTELNSAIKFFADPQIGGYLSKNPDLINGDSAVQAKIAYERDYKEQVLPLIQQEFQNANVYVGPEADINPFGSDRSTIKTGNPKYQAPTNEVVRTMFNGTGVSFVANPTNDADRARNAAREAQRLNREVAPVMNNLIKASAHFGGNVDYKSSYEALMSQLTPPVEETANEN